MTVDSNWFLNITKKTKKKSAEMVPVALAVTHPASRDISSSNSPSVDLNLLSRFYKTAAYRTTC